MDKKLLGAAIVLLLFIAIRSAKAEGNYLYFMPQASVGGKDVFNDSYTPYPNAPAAHGHSNLRSGTNWSSATLAFALRGGYCF